MYVCIYIYATLAASCFTRLILLSDWLLTARARRVCSVCTASESYQLGIYICSLSSLPVGHIYIYIYIYISSLSILRVGYIYMYIYIYIYIPEEAYQLGIQMFLRSFVVTHLFLLCIKTYSETKQKLSLERRE